MHLTTSAAVLFYSMDEILNKLVSERQVAERAMREAKRKIWDHQIQMIQEKLGVAVGTVVLYKGREFKVTSVNSKFGGGTEHEITSDIPSFHKPWLNGVPRKKDGTWSAREQCLYSDWKLPDNASTPVSS